MKKLLIIFLYMGLVASQKAFAGDNNLLPPRMTTTTYVVQNQNIGQSDRPAVYNLKNWKIEAQSDPVKHALEVYKKKSESSSGQYNQSIWITNRSNGQRHLLTQFISPNAGNQILFSPDENFLYYLGVGPGGQNLVYGYNLLSNQQFSLGSGQNFNTVNCPNKTSFVVVQQGQTTAYQVYSSTGERMPMLNNMNSPVDIEKNLCR